MDGNFFIFKLEEDIFDSTEISCKVKIIPLEFVLSP